MYRLSVTVGSAWRERERERERGGEREERERKSNLINIVTTKAIGFYSTTFKFANFE